MKKSFIKNLWVSVFFFLYICGCAGKETQTLLAEGQLIQPGQPIQPVLPVQANDRQKAQDYSRNREKLSRVLVKAQIPAGMARRIETAGVTGEEPGVFLSQLFRILENNDPYLRILVDKSHPLPENYEPDDLIELRYKSYRAGITDVMLLRRRAEEALEEMAAAAKSSGFTLTVSSAYRSYQYQIGSFERWTARLGPARAEIASARPGRSQHQLGLAVDFGSITNNFAETPIGKWVAANAGRFGFSLSYPRGYEELTGYGWESWHYRYVGRDLYEFIETWFNSIQQHALRFIHEWEADN
ncbi:MAG: M15 family metallopeptidase [Treponema sp.]|nr:M15 family metallopeptidase [Treponema sp.]